jgi:hypothetical protein
MEVQVVKRLRLAPILLLQLLVGGCSDLLLAPQPSTTPISIFDQFWKEFDQHYAVFAERGINWDSLGDLYRPRITDATPDSDLARTLDSLIQPLHDGHVSLFAGRYNFTSIPDTFHTYDVSMISSYYLRYSGNTTPSRHITYGRIHDSIGYINIATFERSDDDWHWIDEIGPVLDSLADTKQMILDIRENQGGTADVEESIAAHFISREKTIGYTQTRSGPAHDDLSSPLAVTLEPSTPSYTKPVYVLIHQRTMSAAEWFTLALKEESNVITVGDTTFGSFSGRLDRELSNGWLYSLSFMRVTDANHMCYEGRGIPPEYVVHVPRFSPAYANDTVIERTLHLIEK